MPLNLDHRAQPIPIRAGDFGLVHIAGRLGQVVEFGEWLNGDGFRTFSHVWLALSPTMLIEAEPGGARVRKIMNMDIDSAVISRWPLTEDQRRRIADVGHEYEGIGYSFLDYAALSLHRFHLNVPGLQGYIESTGHVICSQLVDLAYQGAGLHMFDDGRWPGYVTPGALARALSGPITAGTVAA